MVNMTGVITLEQLAKYFTSLFQHRAFRLETLDFYDAANEREPYAAFLAGQPVDPAWRRPWQGLVRGVRESGRTMERMSGHASSRARRTASSTCPVAPDELGKLARLRVVRGEPLVGGRQHVG